MAQSPSMTALLETAPAPGYQNYCNAEPQIRAAPALYPPGRLAIQDVKLALRILHSNLSSSLRFCVENLAVYSEYSLQQFPLGTLYGLQLPGLSLHENQVPLPSPIASGKSLLSKDNIYNKEKVLGTATSALSIRSCLKSNPPLQAALCNPNKSIRIRFRNSFEALFRHSHIGLQVLQSIHLNNSKIDLYVILSATECNSETM